ncbi:MAG: DNA-directed DNA polymerase I [Candidatus Hodarchaeota archaeon]
MPSDLSSWMPSSSDAPQKGKPRPKPNQSSRPSLLTQILEYVDEEPVRPRDYPRTPSAGPPGVLLNIDYQGDAGVAKLKLYDTQKGEIYEWQDITEHHPYCLTDLSRDELSQRSAVVEHSGFLRLEETKKYNLLLDRDQLYRVIVAKDPLAIGGRPDSIREKLGREHSWEADIRYTHCYTMDRALTPGLLYRVQNGRLAPMPHDFSPKDAAKIRTLFTKGSEIAKLVDEYLPLFLTPATYIPRLALDIEVESEFIDRIPDPEEAAQPVISVAIVDDSGNGRVFLLRRKIAEGSKPKIPKEVKVVYFDDEQKLLERVFYILWRTPVLLTFNGDNFDLRYLVNRAKKFDIPIGDIPIRLRGGFRGNPEADLDYGVHIDLYRFFHNRSIQIYAFRNQYQEVRLETISQALLGEGKLELPEEITQLPFNLLIEYNWQDADLTMRLTQFDSNLVMNLILLLMRLSHQGMHDLTRTAVSNWIRSLLYYAHRQRNFLIPRQDEIATLKGEAVTEAIIKGKKYLGAIVVDPKAGVHFNVTVMDFASLYPSIMKAYNLSYETIRCDHPECKANTVPDTPHWVCTRREGLTSLIIGLVRDLRVEHFKPRATDPTLPEAQRSWFSVVEQALKVFSNAAYGVLGAAHFPLYCAPAAESITALGRFAITETIKKAEELGVSVLYGDTDSLFLDNPREEQLRQLIEYSEKELRVELDVEKEYRYVALSSRKKNYLGVSKDGYVDIKGLTGKKRNTPAFLQDAFMQMIEILRQVRDPDGFELAKEQILRLAREKLSMLERREFAVEDLAIRVQLTKNLDAYTKTTPQHVKAAKQLQEAGREVKAGDIIAFVKTTSGVKPVEQTTVQDVDTSKYKELVKSTFEQVLDALGIEWFDTIGMRTLDTFFG